MKIVTRQQGEFWTDEAGNKIPANRVTKLEKLREKSAFTLATKAGKLSDELASFKALVMETCDNVVKTIMEELKRQPSKKGALTWYNFDQTIKVECDVNEAIRFDPIIIEAAKEKLLEVISANIQGDDFIKEIVIDAFQTTSGKLDTRRVLGLRKHTSKIKTKSIRDEWESAMALIDKSITRPDSKTYYRVSLKDDQGEWQVISLDFSSVKPAVE
jgi:hypothetical protein